MLIDLSGKVAIVTGAGRGIGREIARTLAAEGVTVVVTDIRQDLLDQITAEWAEMGWPGSQLLCDVRKTADCRAVAAKAEQAFGRIDILVINAGVAKGARVAELDEQVGSTASTSNLSGTILRMCQAVISDAEAALGPPSSSASFAAIIPSVGGAAMPSARPASKAPLTRARRRAWPL